MSSVLERLKLSKSQTMKDFEREEINPKNMQGKRLSKYWKKGDTFLSVSIKKTKSFFFNLFNPHNYSKTFLDNVNYDFIKNKNYIIIFSLVFIIPLVTYAPVLYTKFLNVKNIYYLDKIAKRQFIEKKFNLKNKRISLLEIIDNLKKNNN